MASSNGQTGQRFWKRYEAKYLVPADVADQLRGFCCANTCHDPFSARQPSREYPVQSVYYDSADRVLLQRTIEGVPDRFKLRVRSYRHMNETGSLPEFYEVKRKAHGIVFKTRVERTDAAGVFSALRRQTGARPVLGVFYLREAFDDPASGVRVSFDRGLHFGVLPNDAATAFANGDASICDLRPMWSSARMSGIVFEIKFTNVFPFWIQQLVHSMNLVRRGVCKYVTCSEAAVGRFPSEP